MLTQHLREMEEDGLVIRKGLSDRVLHVEYSLSDSRGLAVLQLIGILRNWSKEHLNGVTEISKECESGFTLVGNECDRVLSG